MRRFQKLLILILGSRLAQGSPLPSVDRIVGGAPINITTVPFMASFRVNDNHACGSIVIAREWGLTAGHCVLPFINNPYDKVTIRSGSSYLDFGGTIHDVTMMAYHPKYDPDTNDYDVGIFKVDPPFEFSDTTKPAKLPDPSEPIDMCWGLVAGWGYFIDRDPILSEGLQYVILPKVDQKECREDYKDRYVVTDRQICYGFRMGGKDSCKGDSGGPLIRNDTVIGITSWGDDCGEPNSPGVYTNVVLVADWIKNATTTDSTENASQ